MATRMPDSGQTEQIVQNTLVRSGLRPESCSCASRAPMAKRRTLYEMSEFLRGRRMPNFAMRDSSVVGLMPRS